MSPWSAISGYFVLTMRLSLLYECRTDECRRAYVRSTQLIDRLGPSQPASCAAGRSPGRLDEGDQVVIGTTGEPRMSVAAATARAPARIPISISAAPEGGDSNAKEHEDDDENQQDPEQRANET